MKNAVIKNKNIFTDNNFFGYRFIVIAAASIILLSLCLPLALYTPTGQFPDEGAHMNYINEVVKSGYPNYGNGFGEREAGGGYLKHPPLYYMIAGSVAKIESLFSPADESRLLTVRLLNVLLTLATLIVVGWTMMEFNVGIPTLAFILLAWLSIPMIVIVGSSASNDPLSFLGASLFIWGLCRWHHKRRSGLGILLTGAVIACLTKATAGLAVGILALCYTAFNARIAIKRIKLFDIRDWLICFLALLVVGGFYIVTFYHYGEIFPRAGPGPADVFASQKPDAIRRNLLEQIEAFYRGNVYTLLNPYTHELKFEDSFFRIDALKLLILSIFIINVFGICRSLVNQNLKNGITVPFLIAIIIYIFIYFFSVYLIHLRTGYPGAHQARYTFALLPALFVGVGIGFQGLNSVRPVQMGLLFLGALAVSGLFVVSWSGLQRSSVSFVLERSKELPAAVVETAGNAGYVDSVRYNGGRAYVSGWARDVKTKKAAAYVIMFYGDRFVGVTVPDIDRPDVVAARKTISGEDPGYILSLSTLTWSDTDTCRLRLFAVQLDGSLGQLRGPCRD